MRIFCGEVRGSTIGIKPGELSGTTLELSQEPCVFFLELADAVHRPYLVAGEAYSCLEPLYRFLELFGERGARRVSGCKNRIRSSGELFYLFDVGIFSCSKTGLGLCVLPSNALLLGGE
jgi:hypothetical protein